jgi:signal transduction histidine kinase
MSISLHRRGYGSPIWVKVVIAVAIVAIYGIALGYVDFIKAAISPENEIARWLPLALRILASTLYIIVPIITWYAFRLTAVTSEYSQLQNQFISNASHELRTPLAIILGYSGLAVDGDLLQEQGAAAWEQVHKSANRIKWLTDNILGVARLEAGANVPTELVSLAVVVQDVVDSMGELARKGNVFLAVGHLSGCSVHGSEPLLFLAISNLVSNAIKFSPGGVVTVSLAHTSHVAIVSIVDTGIGMSKATQSVAFEKFRQGDGSDTRRYGGTGIGLHFVKLVAEFHHGH